MNRDDFQVLVGLVYEFSPTDCSTKRSHAVIIIIIIIIIINFI